MSKGFTNYTDTHYKVSQVSTGISFIEESIDQKAI